MREYGQLSVMAAGWVFLVFLLGFAAFVAVFALLAGELSHRWHLNALYLFPFVWVAMEWGRSFIPFGGFIWNPLGNALVDYPGWTQPATFTGVYGLSFIVATVNAAVAGFWLAPSRRKGWQLGAVAVVLALTAFLGTKLPMIPQTHNVVLVQPNLPQQLSPDPEWSARNRAELVQLEKLTSDVVRGLTPTHPPLVIWPELPVALYYHQDPVLRARFAELTQSMQSYFITGIVDFHPDRSVSMEEGAEAKRFPYNSAVLLSPDGAFVGQYDKIHLVPFGEYLPWANVLGLAGSLVQEVGGFHSGETWSVWPIGDGRVSVFICYEAIFPGQVRKFVDRGATVLVNISNDGWFGDSAAPAQHLNMARMRAVEAGRFLLRSTNTGLTATVDPYGRVLAKAPQHQRSVLAAGFAHLREKTFYVRYGDWFTALCSIVMVGALVRRYWLDAVEADEV
jgi:apolipoprotein N-acyltransferase